ncbi:GATA transcription factor 14 [Acorus gramineus]|uniref:GATA transcription factor 14 n=1 Tax=Acorus gramineus TaxID=55184 RepID=A0AAV9AH93_ACOGR|nr:GATA transcription factor 14 [Acorus gramineus]
MITIVDFQDVTLEDVFEDMEEHCDNKSLAVPQDLIEDIPIYYIDFPQIHLQDIISMAYDDLEDMQSSSSGGSSPTASEAMRSRRCNHCKAESTPLWREGPDGKGTLCNACGLRYRAGKLMPEYRPLASPTFDDSVHTNRRPGSKRQANALKKRKTLEFLD